MTNSINSNFGYIKVSEQKMDFNDNARNFKVKVNNNVKITNYVPVGGEAPKGSGYITANAGPNQTTVIDESYLKNVASMEFGTKRYNIFDALRKLDGDSTTLSEEDLANANSLINKKIGIKNIKRDANVGVTTIVCDDGAVLRFDFETKTEKAEREKQEKLDAEMNSDAQQKADAQKRKEQAELKEATTPWLEKVGKKLVNFIFN